MVSMTNFNNKPKSFEGCRFVPTELKPDGDRFMAEFLVLGTASVQ